MEQKKDPAMLQYLKYSSMGIEMAILVVGGLFLGRWLDRQWNTSPYLMIGCLLFGMAVFSRNLVRLVAQTGREDERQPPPKDR